MADDPPHEEVLFTAAKRIDLLRSLADGEGAKDIRDLRDALDASRSTVYKATRQLESVRVVESNGDGYRLTLFGRLVLRKLERTFTETRTFCEIEDVLADLPSDLPIDPALFSGATVVTPGPHAPDCPVDALEAFVADTGRVRTLTPVARARYLEFGEAKLDADGAFGGEFLMGPHVVEYALSTFPDAFARVAGHEAISYFETASPIPFGLVLPESASSPVGVTLYDDRRQLHAFVRTDDPAAAQWAAETYAAFRADATPLSPAAVSARTADQ